jgi:hypothetical protein
VKLSLEFDREAVAAGEAVTGRVRILEGGASRSLTLTVSFCERSPSFLTVASADSGVIHEGDLATGGAVDFRFALPASAPPTVRGRHGELFWQLEAVSDEPGLDTRVARPFEVVARRD